MLHIIEAFCNLPVNIDMDPDINYQPGQIGSLKIKKEKSVIGLCDGLHPFGIIDDIKSDTIRSVVLPKDSEFIIPASNFEYDTSLNEIVLTKDQIVELKNTNIISSSFICSINVELKNRNGLVIIPKGTICNYCINPSPHKNNDINNAVRFIVNYAYTSIFDTIQDSVSHSEKVTVWTKNMIYDTDMYDTSAKYSKYSNLYVTNGLLTTKRSVFECKCIGVVLIEPMTNNGMLRVLWDPNNNIEVSNAYNKQK